MAMLSAHEFASCRQAMSKACFECGIAQVSLGLQQHPTMVAILSFLKSSHLGVCDITLFCLSSFIHYL